MNVPGAPPPRQLSRCIKLAFVLCLAIALGAGSAGAVGQFHGPSAYLQFSDSPFARVDFSNGYFHLETFEDGRFDVPGAILSGGGLLTPGPLTDSVDADDGAIDGFGNRGHSWWHGGSPLTITFDAAALGMLPTHAGVVVTDTDPGPNYFEAFDASGNSLGVVGPYYLADNSYAGTTGEDRFFGVMNAGGISAIRVRQSYGVEIDHLQYGNQSLAVSPEPAGLVIGGLDASRSGHFNLLTGAGAGNFRSVVRAAFPHVSLVGSPALSDEFLAGIDVAILFPATSHVSGMVPLSPSEQQALRDFVMAGGGVIILADNDTFTPHADDINESLLDPFGLDISGTLFGYHFPATIPSPGASPVTAGPFGTVSRFNTVYPGWFNHFGPHAIPLAALDANGQPCLAVIPRAAMGTRSGSVVLFSDSSILTDDFWTEEFGKLILNSIAFTARQRDQAPADEVAPSTITTSTPAPNAVGWNNTAVSIKLEAADNEGGSGVREISYRLNGRGWTSLPGSSGSFAINEQGVHLVEFRASDNVGNVEAVESLTVRIDTAPPTLSFRAPQPPANTHGWHRADVTVAYTAADNLSGVASPGAAGTLSFTTEGAAQTQHVTVTDAAGNSATFDSPAVSIDRTAPVVTYSGAQSSYTVDQEVAITCAASEALSGVDTHTCRDVTGPAYSFPLGVNTFTATATDRAGNTGSGSVSFTVSVTYESLRVLTRRFVKQAGIANALCAKLDAAEAAERRGNAQAETGALEAYRNHLQAQSGKALTTEHAALLIRLSQTL